MLWRRTIQSRMYDLWDDWFQRHWVRKVVLAHGCGRPKASVRYLILCRAAKTIAEKMEALVELVGNHMVGTIRRL